jgi:NCS2 family nucleobase:cation symporter-2
MLRSDQPAMTTAADVGLTDPVNEIPALVALLGLSLQHVVAMYAGAVTVPLLIGRALNLSSADLAYLISADQFACGLVTLIQVLGFGSVGVRLPVIMGVTFVAVMPSIAIASDPTLGLRCVFGSSIVAGIILLPLTYFSGWLLRILTPIVTGTTMLLVGISILVPTADWAAGGRSATDFGAMHHWALAGLTMAVILAVTRLAPGRLSHCGILIGIAVGYLAAMMISPIDFSPVRDAAVVQLVTPFHFGPPLFDARAIVSMAMVIAISMVESSGMLILLGQLVGQPLTDKKIGDGLRADCIGTAVGGLFNSFSYTSYSQNIALVGVTGVKSRFVCAGAAVILMILGLFPKISAVIAEIPTSVLGGSGLIMSGTIIAAGAQQLARADLVNSKSNMMIAASAIGLGMVPIVAHDSLVRFPAELKFLFESGVLIGILTAVLLTTIFAVRNGRSAHSATTLPAE